MVIRWAKSTARAILITRDKIRTGERWYDEHVADPLLEEVEAAKENKFPGEYGSRTSQWEDAVSATARRKADKQIQEAATDYVDSLTDVANLEEKRINTAEYFIGTLPGGEVDGTDVFIVAEVTREQGQYGPAQPRPEIGEFDLWLDDAWTAFEESDSISEFERQIHSVAQQPQSSLDPDVFQCWEDQLRQDDWPTAFWSAHNDEYLQRYRRTVHRLRTAKETCATYANEVDALIETRIK